MGRQLGRPHRQAAPTYLIPEAATNVGSRLVQPRAFFIALIGPWIPKLRRSPIAQAFLKGVNAAVLAPMLSVTFALFRSAVVDGRTVLLLAAALVALLRLKVDAIWLVASAAALGFLHLLLV